MSSLSPKAKRFYKIAKGLLNTARKLENQNVSARQRIKKALKAADIEEVAKGRLNNVTIRFIKLQLKLQLQRLRGRRFSLEDKIFALSLLE